MKLLERTNLDAARWDALVDSSTEATFFSYSWYLDAIAENWCVVVDEEYTVGMAIPFTIRLGQKIAYTPIFVSYLEVLGKEAIDSDVLNPYFLNHFTLTEITLKTAVLGKEFQEFVTQIIPAKEEPTINSQAKRMLKKAKTNSLEIRESRTHERIYPGIVNELKGKFSGMTEESLTRLKSLFEVSKSIGQLISFEVWKEDICQGGIVCLQKKDQLFYLKGVCNESSKKVGGMYLALFSAISYAKEQGILFDFGGSRVEGVRGFNKNLGGIDQTYYFYEIDTSPFWFKWARKIKSRIKNH